MWLLTSVVLHPRALDHLLNEKFNKQNSSGKNIPVPVSILLFDFTVSYPLTLILSATWPSGTARR